VRLYVTLPLKRKGAQILGSQFLRSEISVGANYREASRARSDAEFVSKIDQCSQEADETLYWGSLLRDECGVQDERLTWIESEANELISMFVTMSKRTKARMK